MVPDRPKPQIEKRPMLYAILPLQRFAVASRLSRPARSFFSTPSFLKKPARQSQYGGTATNACRAASMAARRSSDLSGGSTGVLICTLQHGACRARRNKRRSGFCTSAGKPAVALTSRAPDYQFHPPLFEQEANRLDALKYREQGFGLRSLITCVKSHMQGDQIGH